MENILSKRSFEHIFGESAENQNKKILKVLIDKYTDNNTIISKMD